jgi:hypothetical protein
MIFKFFKFTIKEQANHSTSMMKTLISKWNDPNKNMSYSIPTASLMQVPSNSGMLMLGMAGPEVIKTAR